MITQKYNLNLIPNSAILLVKCSQFDKTLRTLTFDLFEGSTAFQIPSGTTATISGTKPDKTGFSYEMTVGTSSVSIDVTEQMTAVAGPVVCEITLADGSGQISTTNFVLQVEPSALAGTEISETEIPILQEAIEAAETVVSLSETFGSPLVAQTAAEMTLTNRVYVYTGSESGYTAGNWYYYNGSAWVSGGVYQSAAVAVDSALSTTSQNPVQNKVITSEITDLKSAIDVFSGTDVITPTLTSGSYYSYFDGSVRESNQYENAVIQYDGISDIIVRTNANSIAPIACYYNDEPSTSAFLGYEHAEYPASYGTLRVVDYHLTIPSGTTYITVNNKPADGPGLLIELNSVEYTVKRIENVEEKVGYVADNISGFVDITNTITKISGTNYGAQGFPSTNAQYESAVIAVEENDLIEITTNGNSAAPCCGFYNGTPAHATWISNDPSTYPPSYGTLSVKRYLLTIPSGTKYIAINNKIADGDMFVYKYQQIDIAEKLLSYEGKNILLLGDSITQLGMQTRGWPLYFDRIVKANQIDNVAVIGARWCDYNSSTVYNGNPQAVSDEQNVIGNQVQKIINNPSSYLSDYDVVIIAAGTNDLTSTGELTTASINTAFYNNGAVRALSDVDRSTWAGATRWATEKLRELFPSAVIVYNTPINRIEGYDSARVKNNANMIRQCAEINSVMLCDSMHCGITMSDSTDFVDGLHPSVQGAKKLGTYNAKWFSKNITEFID